MKVNRDNLKKVQAQLKQLGGTKILLGVIPGVHPDSDLTNAKLMDIHEQGAKLKNGGVIPARAPFRNTVRSTDVQTRASVELQGLIRVNTTDKGLNVKKITEGYGEFWAGEVKDAISQGLSPQLAESTLAARRRKGIGGNLPLFATHRLRDTVDFQIERGK